MRKTVVPLIAALAGCVLALALHARSSVPTMAADAGAESLYITNCSGCHGATGQGAVNIAPPLAKNPYVTGDPKKVIQAVAGGMAGPIREHGSTWSGSMPPWQGTLTNAQLADVITYIRTSWGNKASSVSERQVAAKPASALTQPSHSNAPAVTMAEAESLYVTNCSGCHGASGAGAVNIAPALAKNRDVTGDPKKVIQIVVSGSVGPIKEGGTTWTGSMPPWNTALSNAQLAAVITYIRSSWGNKAAPVSEKQVATTHK